MQIYKYVNGPVERAIPGYWPEIIYMPAKRCLWPGGIWYALTALFYKMPHYCSS